ncbi:unnamed protein product [Absidia cylindrospora]
MVLLTENLITTLYANDGTQPIRDIGQVQIINLKSIEGTNLGSARYRAIISDGNHFMQAMLATKQTAQIETGQLVKHSVVHLTECVINAASSRKILIILEMEVVSNQFLERIGNPVHIEGTRPPTAFTTIAPGQSSQNALQAPIQPTPRFPQLPRPIQQPSRPSQQIQPSLHQHMRSPQGIQQSIMSQQALLMQNTGSGNPFEPSSSHQGSSLLPIHCLNPYQNKWKVKARVVQKTDIKTWANARTEGKLFSVNLLDHTGEIKATAFQKEVDRLYSLLVEGQVYYISNARVIVAKKAFSTLKNEYELVFEHSAEVVPCANDPSIPSMSYSFTKIADMDKKEKDDIVDVLGIVRQYSALAEIIAKSTGAPIKKRDLTVVDETQKEIRVAIWGRAAEMFNSSESPVVVFKGLKVHDFGGRTLSLSSSGTIKINPDIPEARSLRSWYQGQGQNATYSGFTNTMSSSGTSYLPAGIPKMTIGDAKYKCNMGETIEFFAVRGTIIFIKNDLYCYPACPECRKKLVLEGDVWHCEKCAMVHSAPDYKYVLTFTIEDATAQLYVTAFDEVATQLLQRSANEMTQLKETYGFEHVHMGTFDIPKFKIYNFKIKAQQRVYNDIPSMQYVVLEVANVDFVKDGQELVAAIDQLMA